MNLWPFKKQETRAADPSWSALINSGNVSASGQFVDAKSAEGISAVFGAVQAIAESVASLPLHVYQRIEGGDRERVTEHHLADVLREPNEYQTGLAFRENMTASVLLHGNAYARIESNAAGEVTALHPLNPRGVTPLRLPSGRIAYDYADGAGTVQRLLHDEVLHLRDRTEGDGLVGRSRIQIARDTLGLGLALKAHGSRTFNNGARLSGVLQTPHVMSDDSITRLAEGWQAQFSGTDNAGKTAILENGLQYAQLSMSLEDAQWIAAQQFNVEEVARIFRIPPTMIADLRHGSYSNTVELGTQFVRYTLQRWINMWEGEISRSLLAPIARRRYFAEHSLEGLLRGDAKQRAEFYQSAIAAGWMTVEEVRKLQNLPKLAAPAPAPEGQTHDEV